MACSSQVQQNANLHDLTSDNLKVIFGQRNVFPLRSVCKGLKARIECIPELSINLSRKGSEHATSQFFACFHGKMTIGSKYESVGSFRWLKSLLDACNLGLKVEEILPILVDSLTMPILAAIFEGFKHKSNVANIGKISFNIKGTIHFLETFQRSLSTIKSSIDQVDLRVDVTYRPDRTLEKTAQLIETITSACSIWELAVRSDRSGTPTPRLRSFPFVGPCILAR
jgi:hypothetical protein